MTAITHIGLAVPDLDVAIKWYEQVLRFKLLEGPYSFDAGGEKRTNMTNDLLGDTVKKMGNAHLMAIIQWGLSFLSLRSQGCRKVRVALMRAFFIFA